MQMQRNHRHINHLPGKHYHASRLVLRGWIQTWEHYVGRSPQILADVVSVHNCQPQFTQTSLHW